MNSKKIYSLLVGAVLVIAALGTGCGKGSSLAGTYSNSNGYTTMDLKSDGTAVFSRRGKSEQCTYVAENQVLTVTCPDSDPLEFTIHEDGSLASIGTIIGTMTKSKQ